jgi:3'-phosphoadenosine 5'-phosphosulfate sulfotransferase (PAPS reductase)/FAD synthetase
MGVTMGSEHYKLELPAVVAFSGGRTSGYMLWHILDAFEGKQPDDLKVCFQNTGLEHDATYQFVKDCAKHWGVEITWLEYATGADAKPTANVVAPDAASRTGEPFDRLIETKKYLPNPVARVCTSNLKMRTQDRHLKGFPAFEGGYTNAVGLRADEPRRAQRIKSDNGREAIVCPLYDAGVTEADVIAWWAKQPFDLGLPMKGNTAGNCVGCFLKSRHKLDALMREMPQYFDWWVKAEETGATTAGSGARFRQDRPSYADMMEQVKRQGVLPFAGPDPDDESIPCFCHD